MVWESPPSRGYNLTKNMKWETPRNSTELLNTTNDSMLQLCCLNDVNFEVYYLINYRELPPELATSQITS